MILIPRLYSDSICRNIIRHPFRPLHSGMRQQYVTSYVHSAVGGCPVVTCVGFYTGGVTGAPLPSAGDRSRDRRDASAHVDWASSFRRFQSELIYLFNRYMSIRGIYPRAPGTSFCNAQISLQAEITAARSSSDSPYRTRSYLVRISPNGPSSCGHWVANLAVKSCGVS